MTNHELVDRSKGIADAMSNLLRNYPEFTDISMVVTADGNSSIRLTNIETKHSTGVTVVNGSVKTFEEWNQ